MKILILLFVLFLSSGFKALADCSSNRLYAFPESGQIKQNSIFVVEGYAMSQQIIHNLNIHFPVYLQSGKEKVPLHVFETHTSQFYLTQALLKPERPLIPGKTYQLLIDSLPGNEFFGSYNAKTHQYDPVTYLVAGENDLENPQWSILPREKDKILIHHGCGPTIYVNFNFTVKDQSAVLIKTTIRSLESGLEAVYYTRASDGVAIGHSMCSGSFTFNEGANYQAKFAAMDFSGNVSEETGWIEFTKPTD